MRQGPVTGSIKQLFLSERNSGTLTLLLKEDFEQKNGVTLDEMQTSRLSKTVKHYLIQVYEKQGDKPIPVLNKEVLGACAKDFSQYLQRKEVTQGNSSIKTVKNTDLYQETSQRFERLTQDRNEVKAPPPAIPDFRMSFTDDGPSAAEMFERAKKQREKDYLRSQDTSVKQAENGLQNRIMADASFQAQQDSQNRDSQLAVMERNQQSTLFQKPVTDTTLTIMPDRRELLKTPIGSFDTMTQLLPSLNPRDLGQANANPTIIEPTLAAANKTNLQQNYIIREESTISYREVENNLFIYSADRDWLRNNKENRYNFTVNFDPAANNQGFGPSLASQQRFKNIVRIELVKCIMPGESLNVAVIRSNSAQTTDTSYQDNILNLPYVIVRVAELENNNYGTDNFIDRSFGVLQYDAQWISDMPTQITCNRGFLAMIPKFLKCQKEYYPTPLSTLQKMTIDIRRPNGELITSSPDTFSIAGIIAPQIGATLTYGTTFPFTVPTTNSKYNITIPTTSNYPANFIIVTQTFFSKFEICKGDRLQMSGYSYANGALNDPTYGQSLIGFSNWINNNEGHIALDFAYTSTNGSGQPILIDGFNDVGYANCVVIQARYADPTTGNVQLNPFDPNMGVVLNSFGISLLSPVRLMNLNKQLSLVFRIITRELDSLPQIRPDNNY
jgi:hypothetical protein